MGDTALIVEGGAMRAIYAAGVLDVFHETGFDPFDRFYGVSAGALNLTSFMAGQHRRNYRILTRLAVQPEFIRLGRMMVPGASVMDLDWLWGAMLEHEPLDVQRALGGGRRLTVCCTRKSDGQAVYFQPEPDTWQPLAFATCALPGFYRRPVHFAGESWLDGAISDPLPVRHAHAQGSRRLVMIRTRPAHYRKRNAFNRILAVRSSVSAETRGLRDAIESMAGRYNASIDFMESPPADTEVWQIHPSRPLLTGRTTRNRSTLEADYLLGRADAHAFLDDHGASFRPAAEPLAPDQLRVAVGSGIS